MVVIRQLLEIRLRHGRNKENDHQNQQQKNTSKIQFGTFKLHVVTENYICDSFKKTMISIT